MITENFKGVIRFSFLVPRFRESPETNNEQRATSSNFLLGRKFPGLVLEHHRDVVLDGIAEAAGPADELGLRLAIEQGPLAERADQDVEQLRVHVFKTSPVNADGRRY